jgi:signal transduction histidine kinase
MENAVQMKLDKWRTKYGNSEVQIKELFRNYNINTELIKKTTDLEGLLDLILKEYVDRFDEVPGVDLVKVDDMDEKCPVREKLRSLVMFASQAVILKENAEIFRELEKSNRTLVREGKKLEKQNRQLEQLSEQYLNMLGFVSHELRSPLISILGFAELLDEDMLGELKKEQRKAVSIIIRSCRTLIDMIKNYLDLARIEQGEMILDKKALDIHRDIVLLVLEEMTEQFRKKGLSIWVESDSKSAPVECDPGLIRVVFNNLLSNAVKYSNHNSKICVRFTRKEDHFEISVINTGQGLEKSQVKKLFRKFTQLEVENGGGHRNSGLGLYNAKYIVEKHRGKIWADSEAGKSFTVTFTLPAIVQQAAAERELSLVG